MEIGSLTHAPRVVPSWHPGDRVLAPCFDRGNGFGGFDTATVIAIAGPNESSSAFIRIGEGPQVHVEFDRPHGHGWGMRTTRLTTLARDLWPVHADEDDATVARVTNPPR